LYKRYECASVLSYFRTKWVESNYVTVMAVYKMTRDDQTK